MPHRSAPLSQDLREGLARALHERTLESVHGQLREHVVARWRDLRESPEPARLLREWFPTAPEGAPRNYGWMLVALAHAGHDERVRAALADRRVENLRDPKNLAAVVATERAVRGWSQDALASVTGLDVSSVRALERSDLRVSLPELRAVLRALDVEVTALPPMTVEA